MAGGGGGDEGHPGANGPPATHFPQWIENQGGQTWRQAGGRAVIYPRPLWNYLFTSVNTFVVPRLGLMTWRPSQHVGLEIGLSTATVVCLEYVFLHRSGNVELLEKIPPLWTQLMSKQWYNGLKLVDGIHNIRWNNDHVNTDCNVLCVWNSLLVEQYAQYIIYLRTDEDEYIH